MTMTVTLGPARRRLAARPRRRTIATGVLYGAWRGLCFGLLLLVLAVAVLAVVIPKATGAVPLSILSNSMAPSMPVGDLAVVKPTMRTDDATDLRTLDAQAIDKINDVDELVIGDVIAYQPEATDSTLIIHRITDVTVHADGTRTYIVKGDNNGAADQPVEGYQVRGKVWYHLPWIGYANTWLNGNGPRHMAFVISIAVVGYSWAMVLLFRAFRRRRLERLEQKAPQRDDTYSPDRWTTAA